MSRERGRQRSADAILRSRIYRGEIVELEATAASLHLVRMVQAALVDALADDDPRTAQHRLGIQEVRRRLMPLREALAEAPRFLDAAAAVVAAARFDLTRTVFHPPRLRAVFSGGHLNPAAGPAYALHRDTWFANPAAQVNWWIPLHDVAAAETFALYPQWFQRPVTNGSSRFDYAAWVEEVGWQALVSDPARYPTVEADGFHPGPAREVALPRGGMLLFSGAHLHRSLQHDGGATRFSIDFRTVDTADHAAGRGAPDPDNESHGSALSDFVSVKVRR